MLRTLWLQLLAWGLAAVLAGCVVQAPYPSSAPVDSGTQAGTTDESEEQAPEAPPPLPVYDQPPAPADGYIWTPGVWRWGPEGFFWVPGTWVAPPQVGFLWTPGYWGLVGAVYVFHPGHWGPHIGYYGGIVYGHGYDGEGYHGGRWVNNHFQYNTAVTNVNITNVHNVYHETVVNNVTVNNTRVSYVGAPGSRSQPSPAETAHFNEPHLRATPAQMQHHVDARGEPTLNAGRNEGRPPIAGTPHPGAFREPGATAAKPVGEPYKPQRPMPRDDRKKEDKHQ